MKLIFLHGNLMSDEWYLFFWNLDFQIMIPRDAPVLVVKEPWISMLLDGIKRLEIRGSSCRKPAGTIVYLARSGTQTVFGHVTFVDCEGPLSTERWNELHHEHCVIASTPPYDKTFAWRFANAERLAVPEAYKARHGAVVWHRFDPY